MKTVWAPGVFMSTLLSDTVCVGHVAFHDGISAPFESTSMYSAPTTALLMFKNPFEGAHCRTSTGVALLIVGVASVSTG